MATINLAIFAGSLILLSHVIQSTYALRTGAPTLACINMRPIHGLNRPLPASASQFFVSQSSLSYSLGQTVSVDIETNSEERYFRGFFIQAYDPIRGTALGHFLPSNASKPVDTCSAATHRNNLNKKQLTLIWVPPANAFDQAADVPAATSNSTGWFHGLSPLAPAVSVALNNQKRQLGYEGQPSRQVRFRATILVTYDEFYTGFQSSDTKFEKFGFVPASNNTLNSETTPNDNPPN